MSTTNQPSSVNISSDEPIRIQNPESLEGGYAELRLKRHLGQGIYVQKFEEIEDGELEISLGHAEPRDLSDCRDRDKVLKFITIQDVHTLRAKPGDSGHYILEIPEREAVFRGVKERENSIKDKLDFSMATAIYKNVYHLSGVRTQLNPILQILRWTRNRSSLPVSEVTDSQNTENSMEYIELLDTFGYIDVEDGIIREGIRLQSADLHEYGWNEFGEKFLGDVVTRGYFTIRDELGMSMLGHYQKYSSAYYFDAIQRGDQDLWLDIDRIQENLLNLHDERVEELYIHDKLGELDSVNVLEKDGEYVKANEDVYQQVAEQTPVA